MAVRFFWRVILDVALFLVYISCMAPEIPRASWDPKLKCFVIPGKQSTVESVVGYIAKSIKAREITPYRIMRFTGLTMGAVNHFFRGYDGAGPASREAVKTPEGIGRVRLDTFLRIVHAAGYDVELVVRQAPGRDDA